MAPAQHSEWNVEPGHLRVHVEDELGNVAPRMPQKCGVFLPRSGEGGGQHGPLRPTLMSRARNSTRPRWKKNSWKQSSSITWRRTWETTAVQGEQLTQSQFGVREPCVHHFLVHRIKSYSAGGASNFSCPPHKEDWTGSWVGIACS